MALSNVTSPSGSIYAAVIREQTWINVLKDWETEYVIQAEEEVLGVELTISDEELPNVWVSTGHAVWLVSSSHLSSLSQSSPCREDADMSGDIFDDMTTESCESFDITRPALLDAFPLGSGHLVWKEAGVEAFAPMPSFLVLSVRNQCGALCLKILKVPDSPGESATVTASWTLPDSYTAGDGRGQTEGSRLKLKIVTSGSSSASWHSCSSQALTLDSSLFVRMFGVDASLLNSPVVLACSEEGLVFHRPLRSLTTISNEKHWSPWKLLCDAGGQIQNVLTLSLPGNILPNLNGGREFLPEHSDASSTGNSRNNTLCLVTFLGRVTLILASTDTQTSLPGRALGDVRSPSLICTRSGTLSSSVLTSSSEGSALYHSSGRAVMCSKLSLDAQTWGGDVVSEVTLTHLVTFRKSATGEVRLACLLPSGQLLQTKAKVLLPEPGDLAACIKTALLGLHGQGREMERLDSLAQDRTHYLRQLQTAARLVHLAAAGPKLLAGDGGCVQCKVEVEARENGYAVDYTVCCCLENKLGVPLSQEWSLAMIVGGNGLEEAASITQSLRLSKGLADGDAFTLRCPLTESLYGDCTVSVNLILHAPDWLSSCTESLGSPSQLLQQTSTGRGKVPAALCIPVATKTLDALCFLHPQKPASEAGLVGPASVSSFGQLLSLSVTVPASVLPFDPHAMPEEEASAAVLRRLLQGCQLSSTPQGHCEAGDWKGRSVSIHVLNDSQTSTGKRTLQEGSLAETVEREVHAGSEGGNKFQVTVRSPHLSLLASVRQALLARLQEMVLQKESVCNLPCSRLQLKKYLSSLRNILEDCHRVGGETLSVADSDLKKLYQDLRSLESPL